MARRKKTAKRKSDSFVLDGSVVLAWFFADEANAYADTVARKVPKCGAVVPPLWHFEVANALLVGERRGRCDQSDISKWTQYLSTLPIVVDHYLGRIFDDVLPLARQHALSVYDAAYLELALRRGLALASLDEPLKKAAALVGVALFDSSKA